MLASRALDGRCSAPSVVSSAATATSARMPAIRIRGIILRLDRVPAAAGGWNAVVALKLRADARDGTPLLDDYYRAEQPAAGDGLKATVVAYGAALDTIFARFQADLGERGASGHAR